MRCENAVIDWDAVGQSGFEEGDEGGLSEVLRPDVEFY